MIAIDSSAIMAILYNEPEATRLRETLKHAGDALISAANVLELQLVIAGVRSRAGWDQVEAVLGAYHIAIRSFDEQQLRVAREAVVRFGKGHHKSALNFGDCFAYALAKSEDIPLLCTGTDFAATDVAIA